MKTIEAKFKKSENNFLAMKTAINNNALSSLTGVESFDGWGNALGNLAGIENHALKDMVGRIDVNNFDSFTGALKRNVIPDSVQSYFDEAGKRLAEVDGMEGFSMAQYKGSEQDIKAANLVLNSQNKLQNEAAEAMFATLMVKYEDEGVMLKVRAAGLGTYSSGNTAWQSASELRPLFGLLRTGDIFRDDVLALYPVFPDSPSHEDRALFAPTSLIAATDAVYPEHDGYGRENHKTQYLKVPVTIPNYLGLCQAPGQRAWTSTDEIESNSIQVQAIGITGKLGANDISFFVETGAMSNNTFGVTSTAQSSDDRSIQMHLRRYPGFSVVDKDGLEVGETLFADFKTAGFEPLFMISFSGNYQRQGYELRLNGGTAEIHGLKHIASGEEISIGRMNAEQKALVRTLTDGAVKAAKLTQNVTNISRGNFGYRIEVFDADKRLSVRRQDPISVKYPITKEDTNQASLDYAISQMGVAINNQCSKKAFDRAQEHLKYITSIDGAAVVGNNQASNVLAGQHYVKASAVNREITLKDVVSTPSNLEVFECVVAAITNELSDMTAALNYKTGLASIAEYSGIQAIEWTVIVHQNLGRFLMRPGDARTLGQKLPLDIKETNFDDQVGKIWLIPKNNSTSEFINPLGGIGVLIAKENIVVQGNVTREQQEYGVVMTLPTYKHWALCPIIGQLVVTDAAEFLGDEGLLTKLVKQRVQVEGLVEGIQALTTATEGNKPVPNGP